VNDNKIGLNVRNIEAWIEALRSGLYTQSRQALNVVSVEPGYTQKGGVGMCCLGVLCNVYKEETGIGEWSEPHGREGRTIAEFITPGHSGERDYLPEDVQAWLGLGKGDRNPFQLGNKNDESEWSFEQIACFLQGVVACAVEHNHKLERMQAEHKLDREEYRRNVLEAVTKAAVAIPIK